MVRANDGEVRPTSALYRAVLVRNDDVQRDAKIYVALLDFGSVDVELVIENRAVLTRLEIGVMTAQTSSDDRDP